MPDYGEKTEAPTARKRSEAREQGNVAKSQDLTAAVSLLGAVLLLGFFGRRLLGGMKVMVETMIGGSWSQDVTRSGDVGQAVVMLLGEATEIIAPVALGVTGLVVVATICQVGFLVTLKPLELNPGKLNPMKGLAQLFGAKAAMRLVMSVLKVAIVCTIAAVTIYFDIEKIAALVYLESGGALAAAASLAYSLALRIAIVLFILGILDFMYQRWQNEREMRMSKQEVKEEHKRMEGDPLVKQRRVKVARQLILQRISQAVPGADVIVTNPTHFAVALKYDGEDMHAPKVVAKGADFLALRIRQLASLHGVPIVERPPLARALYRNVEVGQEIPPEHYAAVAEILAYVYRLSGRQSA